MKLDENLFDTKKVVKESIEKTSKGKWVNRGKEGTHGKFATKKAAREQQKAMFANGYQTEALYNDETKEYFDKAKEIGAKTLGDLQKLHNEPEFFNKDGSRKSDIQGMRDYRKALGKNFKIKNESKLKEDLFSDLEYTTQDAITDFKNNYGKYLDKETFNDALSEMEKAKSVWEIKDIASIYTNLNFYRFKDTDEVVGHGGVEPAKTKNGRDSHTRAVYTQGNRKYSSEQDRDADKTYFDKKLAEPLINKIHNTYKSLRNESLKESKEEKTYKVSFGTGAAELHTEIVKAFNEQEAADKAADIVAEKAPGICIDYYELADMAETGETADELAEKMNLVPLGNRGWYYDLQNIEVVEDNIDESLYKTDSVSGNKMTFEVKDDGSFIVKDGDKEILNTKVIDVENTRKQISTMNGVDTIEEDIEETKTTIDTENGEIKTYKLDNVEKIDSKEEKIKPFPPTLEESVDYSLKELEEDIWKEIRDLYKNADDEEYNNYIKPYTVVEITSIDDKTKVEVRMEASYKTMDKLADKLNPFVQKLDKDAYFDHEDSGIINAYINNKSLKEDKSGERVANQLRNPDPFVQNMAIAFKKGNKEIFDKIESGEKTIEEMVDEVSEQSNFLTKDM